jgi:hypothetical protein
VSDKHNEGFAEVDINTIQFVTVDNAIEDSIKAVKLRIDFLAVVSSANK